MRSYEKIPRFSVTKDGRVFDHHTNSFRSIKKDDNGYSFIRHKGKRLFAHQMVAQIYIPNPLGKPYVNHINGRKADNRVENLEWVTGSENAIHKFDTLGYKIPSTAKAKMSKAWFGSLGYISPNSTFDGYWFNSSLYPSLRAISTEVKKSVQAVKTMFLEGKISYVVDGLIQPLNEVQQAHIMLKNLRKENWS